MLGDFVTPSRPVTATVPSVGGRQPLLALLRSAANTPREGHATLKLEVRENADGVSSWPCSYTPTSFRAPQVGNPCCSGSLHLHRVPKPEVAWPLLT